MSDARHMRGYFTTGSYAPVMGICLVIFLVGSLANILLALYGFAIQIGYWLNGGSTYASNPLLNVVANQAGVAWIFLFVGLLTGALFAYPSFNEFWIQSRPIKIDEFGIEACFLGKTIKRLRWSQVYRIAKLRGPYQFGGSIESIRIYGRKNTRAKECCVDFHAIEQTRAISPWVGTFKLFPGQEIWFHDSGGRKSFEEAAKVITYYALLHGIPMELWDITPGASRSRNEKNPAGNASNRHREKGEPIDRL